MVADPEFAGDPTCAFGELLLLLKIFGQLASFLRITSPPQTFVPRLHVGGSTIEGSVGALVSQ